MAPGKFHQLTHDQEHRAGGDFITAHIGPRELTEVDVRECWATGPPREGSPSLRIPGEGKSLSCSLSCVEAGFTSWLPIRAQTDSDLFFVCRQKEAVRQPRRGAYGQLIHTYSAHTLLSASRSYSLNADIREYMQTGSPTQWFGVEVLLCPLWLPFRNGRENDQYLDGAINNRAPHHSAAPRWERRGVTPDVLSSEQPMGDEGVCMQQPWMWGCGVKAPSLFTPHKSAVVHVLCALLFRSVSTYWVRRRPGLLLQERVSVETGAGATAP